MTHPIVGFLKDIMTFGLESIGRYYSSYRAVVCDTDDPLQIGRVRLVIPEISGTDQYSYWAIPKGAFSGTGFGSQIIPPVGEIVWAEFERGHPEVPIYSHGHFGQGEMPTDDADMLDVNCYWFRTPYGHTIKLNDTKKYITILSSGAEVTINSTGQFRIKNGNMDMKTLLMNMLQTYMDTTTVDEEPLSAESIQAAVQNMQDVQKLFF